MVLKGEITMDAEKVIKALEWLIVNFPKQDNPKDDSDRLCNCINLYCQNAVDLIKRQQAESERYQKNEVEATKICEQMFVQLGELRERVLFDIIKAKKEAYKEFAEKLKIGA